MQNIYRERRNRTLLAMEQGIAIVPTAKHALRNRDSHYPYRFDSHFYYLCGFPEPEAILVLVAGNEPKSILFCREKDPAKEIWDGFRYGLEAAKEAFHVDETHPISSFGEMLPKLLENQHKLYYPVGGDRDFDGQILSALDAVRAQARSGISAPGQIIDVRDILDDMRLVKDQAEIGIMRRAAEISAQAHRLAMKKIRPEMMEYELEALYLHEFRRSGAQSVAYPSIVAGGANACVLHYVDNNRELRAGDLVLVDAGCELDGYAADITRTFPVNGKFSGAQKDLYEVALAAQHAAIAAVKPGASWDEPHQAAVAVIARGLIDSKLCSGTVEAVIESGDYKKFYMHRTGHWLGLDVHDAGSYKVDGKWREFVPGMALTVEPGIYVGNIDSVPPAFRGIGIRIEDDVVVNSDGCEILTASVPKSVAAIEELMRHD